MRSSDTRSATRRRHNWINQNLQALRKQGELDETTGFPIAVSGGIAHPNRDGYAVIGAALQRPHAPGVRGPLHARQRAGDARTTATASGFSVAVDDDELEPLASGYWHRVRVRRLNDNGTVADLPMSPDGLRDFPYGTASTSVRADRPLLRHHARLRPAVAQRHARLRPDERLAAGEHVRAGAARRSARPTGRRRRACSSRRRGSRSAGSTRTRSRRMTRGARSSG